MKERIKRWLLTLGLWLAGLEGASQAAIALARIGGDWANGLLNVAAGLPLEALDLRAEARRVCGGLEITSAAGTSGEWKRHRALADLKKFHPEAATRDIALAIELVMPLVKGVRIEWTS
jgi:hypothetical protein